MSPVWDTAYALFAQGLPPGHLFQDRIENVQCQNACFAASGDVQAAVDQFQNPDVETAKVANAAALMPSARMAARRAEERMGRVLSFPILS